MKTAGLRYIFYACSVFLLIFMLLVSKNAGITCDEVLHYRQSVEVYDYFATHSEDKSALNTPGTHLKYYGQSYDNIATIISKWLNIEDVYSLRHFMSSLAGWLTLLITALFGVWLSGYRTGILVLLLFAVSPTFMGHAQNNLKDIPFALAYISGIFFSLRVMFSEGKIRFMDVFFLVLSIAFAISVRAGGLILICYLFLFLLISVFYNLYRNRSLDLRMEGIRLIMVILISAASFILGILLWPYALQSPVKNVLESYRVMAHFPSTFRQIFEGKMIWSDQMPWYFLLKSMAITIPLIVSAGFVAFLLLARKIIKSGKVLIYCLLIFAIIFPVSFVIIENSNLYSSWRQFLFIYPPVILVAASGFTFFFEMLKKKVFTILAAAALILFCFHPLLFITKNPGYWYLYYNQLTGGLKGAFGNYETDYYYVSQGEASEWLLKYLQQKNIDTAVIAATSSVAWEFRKNPGIKTLYIRYEERSMSDWDYAIVANRYIPPAKLKDGRWPPGNSIHTIYVDSVPVCTVLERKNKSDYQGYKALESGNNLEAARLFAQALKRDNEDEMIFYNFARALYNNGQYSRADSVLKAGLDINPDFEPILMYLGNIAAFWDETDRALYYYDRLIRTNSKYFQAYVESAGILAATDVKKAREMLRECLDINPGYKPAITKLADTYRETNPEIAGKLDEMATNIK